MEFNLIKEKDNSTKNKSAKVRNKRFGTTLNFSQLYRDDDEILKQIFYSRWRKTNGICLGKNERHCGRQYADYIKIPGKRAYRCSCGNVIFPLKGTPLEHIRISLKQVFDALYLMLCSK